MKCAVIDCSREGKSQLCPYDGRFHHHGRIHYDCPRAQPTVLTFDESDWHLICDEHYAVLTGEMLAREGVKAFNE